MQDRRTGIPQAARTGGGVIADAFRRCAALLSVDVRAGDVRRIGRLFETLETSPSAGPLHALARRIALLSGPGARTAPEVAVFLGLLADALPGETEPAVVLALALAAVRAPRAEQSLLSVQERFGVQGPVALALGRIRLERGAAREALADFERAGASGADEAQSDFGQGLAWLALEEPSRAAVALERARERAPGDATVAFHLALALARSGDAGAALAVLDDLVAREPGHARAWFERGNLLQDAGRHGEAAAAFAQALAADPAWAAAAFNRAVSLQADRRLAEAMDGFGQAIRLDPASVGPVAQALTREAQGCLWLEPRRMVEDLSVRGSGP
jgi:tetratricopeptide (TPR) repeat protein